MEALLIWLAFMVPALLVLTFAGWFAETKAGIRLTEKMEALLRRWE